MDFSIAKADFYSGACFGKCLSSTSKAPFNAALPPSLAKPFVPVRLVSSLPRKPIPLQPVNVMDISSDQEDRKPMMLKQEGRTSHWTANWYIFCSQYIIYSIIHIN